MAQAAKQEYIKQCSDSETTKKHIDIFTIIFGFSGILASLFALSLLANNNVRIGLYIILSLLALNSFVVQICKNYHSADPYNHSLANSRVSSGKESRRAKGML